MNADPNMDILDFKSYSLWVNIALFALSAMMVWIAGTRVARHADRIATLTGIGHATVGLVLLAGITSLPEVAVAVSSAAAGIPALAVNNLLGGVAMQIAILAVADALFGKQALTVVAGSPLILLQIVMNVLMLLVFAAGVVVGDTPLWPAGAWTWSLPAIYAFSIATIANSQGRHAWVTQKMKFQSEQSEHDKKQDAALQSKGNPEQQTFEAQLSPSGDDVTLKRLILNITLAAAVILAAGFLLSQTGDAIAAQTGLGQSFVGAVFLAVSTSLPEASTVFSALKLRRYEMAISDIFGTGLFNVTLVFVVDAVYQGGPVLNEVGQFSLAASLIACILASIYLVGLIERRDRTIARMGVDSFAVLLVYFGGLIVLYQLR